MGCVLMGLLAAVLLCVAPWHQVGEAVGTICWILLVILLLGAVSRRF